MFHTSHRQRLTHSPVRKHAVNDAHSLEDRIGQRRIHQQPAHHECDMNTQPFSRVLQFLGQIMDVADTQVSQHLVEAIFLLNDFFLKGGKVALHPFRFTPGCLPRHQIVTVIQRVNQVHVIFRQLIRPRESTLDGACTPLLTDAPRFRARVPPPWTTQLIGATHTDTTREKQPKVLRSDERQDMCRDKLSAFTRRR